MVVDDFSGKLEDAKQWSFDGSSTEQATSMNGPMGWSCAPC